MAEEKREEAVVSKQPRVKEEVVVKKDADHRTQTVTNTVRRTEVKVEDVGTSGFQLTFSIDKQSPLQILFLLTGGSPLLFMASFYGIT